MGRKPGTHKTGGRRPGSPNKETKTIEELCAKHNCSPIEVLIEFCKPIEDGLSPQEIMGRVTQRFNAAKELCQYLYPKRGALAVQTIKDPEQQKDESSFRQQVIAQFKELVKLKYETK